MSSDTTNAILRRPIARTTNMVTSVIGTDTIVFEQDRKMVHTLNHLSSTIWGLADGTRSLEQLATAAQIVVGEAVSLELVSLAVAQLDRAGLLEDAPATPQPPRKLNRRRLNRTLVAGGALVPAVISISAPVAAGANSTCNDESPFCMGVGDSSCWCSQWICGVPFEEICGWWAVCEDNGNGIECFGCTEGEPNCTCQETYMGCPPDGWIVVRTDCGPCATTTEV